MNTLAGTSRYLMMTLIGLPLILCPGFAAADSAMSIAGFVDVPPLGPGGTLTLPLAPGSPPMTIQIQLGAPALQVPVRITTSTAIEETGSPMTLTDGDRVKLDTVIMGGVIQVTRLALEAFPEVQDSGTANGLPAAGVMLPLAPATTVAFTLTLVPGLDVLVVLTENTKLEEGPFLLTNGATVQIDAVVRNMQLVATQISRVDGVENPEPMGMEMGMGMN
jgi:hypothetical protein